MPHAERTHLFRSPTLHSRARPRHIRRSPIEGHFDKLPARVLRAVAAIPRIGSEWKALSDQ